MRTWSVLTSNNSAYSGGRTSEGKRACCSCTNFSKAAGSYLSFMGIMQPSRSGPKARIPSSISPVKQLGRLRPLAPADVDVEGEAVERHDRDIGVDRPRREHAHRTAFPQLEP